MLEWVWWASFNNTFPWLDLLFFDFPPIYLSSLSNSKKVLMFHLVDVEYTLEFLSFLSKVSFSFEVLKSCIGEATLLSLANDTNGFLSSVELFLFSTFQICDMFGLSHSSIFKPFLPTSPMISSSFLLSLTRITSVITSFFLVPSKFVS